MRRKRDEAGKNNTGDVATQRAPAAGETAAECWSASNLDEHSITCSRFPEWEAIARTWVGHNERLSRNKMVGYRPSLRSLYVLPLCGSQLAGHTVNRFVQLGNLLGQVLPAGDEPSSQSVSQSVSRSVGQSVGQRVLTDGGRDCRSEWAAVEQATARGHRSSGPLENHDYTYFVTSGSSSSSSKNRGSLRR